MIAGFPMCFLHNDYMPQAVSNIEIILARVYVSYYNTEALLRP